MTFAPSKVNGVIKRSSKGNMAMLTASINATLSHIVCAGSTNEGSTLPTIRKQTWPTKTSNPHNGNNPVTHWTHRSCCVRSGVNAHNLQRLDSKVFDLWQPQARERRRAISGYERSQRPASERLTRRNVSSFEGVHGVRAIFASGKAELKPPTTSAISARGFHRLALRAPYKRPE